MTGDDRDLKGKRPEVDEVPPKTTKDKTEWTLRVKGERVAAGERVRKWVELKFGTRSWDKGLGLDSEERQKECEVIVKLNNRFAVKIAKKSQKKMKVI
jgi:hypothetical protein